jgi:hypothetical protein
MIEDKSPAEQAAYILNGIKTSTRELARHGRRYETLGNDVMDVLRQVAAGKKVAAPRQRTALGAGEKVRRRLGWAALAALCNFPGASAG